jgi:hypothetical protein
MTVAILVRSVAPALAIAIAWAGPFEHLVARSWDPARSYFRGLLLEVLRLHRALRLVAATVFRRRDVTA